jgi:hypothetical protein
MLLTQPGTVAHMGRSFVAHPAIRKASTYVGEEIVKQWLCCGMAGCGVDMAWGCPGGVGGGRGGWCVGAFVGVCFEHKPFGEFRRETEIESGS